MKDIFNKKKLEDLLMGKWAEFLDPGRLMSTVSELVSSHVESFTFVPNYSHRTKGSQIMVSRLQYEERGFVLWVDFFMPLPGQKVATGTTELFLLHSGILSHSKTLGNVYDCV